MKAIILDYTHPQPLRWGQKVKYFSFLRVVMLQIKLKGKKCRLALHWPIGLG